MIFQNNKIYGQAQSVPNKKSIFLLLRIKERNIKIARAPETVYTEYASVPSKVSNSRKGSTEALSFWVLEKIDRVTISPVKTLS